MRGKIKVLFLAANPIDSSPLRLGDEIRQIDEKISAGPHREMFELIQHHGVRASDLQRVLLQHQPHIVHFCGHGNKTEEIVLQDNQGNSKPVKREALTKLFRILKDNLRVIVLNVCFSKSQAEELNEIVDYTIGMNELVGDKRAISFAGSFYQALTFDRTVTEAFELARLEPDLEGLDGPGTPQLFVRADVNTQRSLLSQTIEAEGLRDALVRLVAVEASPNEKSLIRRAITDGKLVLEQTEEAADTASDVIAKLGQTVASSGLIRLEVGEDAIRRIKDQLYPPPMGLPPLLPGLIFLGREDSLAEIKKRVGAAEVGEPQESSLTVVRGWPGVGKTSLVGFVARDPEIAVSFHDGVLWTALDRSPELISKIAQWGRYLGADDLLRIPGLEEATERLRQLLLDRRMLLIVDDIWNAAHARPFLQATANSKCALVATTRLSSVATELAQLGSVTPYVLPELTEESALLLLRALAPEVVEEHFDECQELVRDLEYLPLALNVAGRMLREEQEIGLDVAQLIEEIRNEAKLLPEPAPLDRAEGATIPTVDALFRRSTDLLDDTTRECFAYLGVFAPKPATFDIEAMKAVWMTDDPKPFIRKLVGYGLLEPVANKRFQMHALLVQHARSLLS